MHLALRGILALCVLSTARADLSYVQTARLSGGAMAAMAGRNAPKPNRISLKGQKLRMDDGATGVLIDLDAQTITTFNHGQKSYGVRNFADMKPPAPVEGAKVEVRPTGQTQVVNGYNASEIMVNLEVEVPQLGKVPLEVAIWNSTEVPGTQEMRDLYTRNAAKFPWQSLTGGGSNPALASAMATLQENVARLNAVSVRQVIRMKAPGGAAGGNAIASPVTGQVQAGMERARKQLEALAAQGGPAAAIARQQLDRMGPPPSASGGGENWLLEMTIDSTDFDNSALPDSLFTIPAGYQKS